jgi:hypothetical protein
MSGAAFLRIKKLKGSGIVTLAARHNKREIQAELGATGSIDPTRSHLNCTLAGHAGAGDVGQLAKDLMTEAGVPRPRKDAVMALEIVFSLPLGHAIDELAYFADCAAWAGRYFGGAVLSADVHQDEAAPHCHVLLLPLVDGRMVGSDMVGGKQRLMALQKQFHLDVAARYGLSKAPARLSGQSKQGASKAVLQRLRETGDKVMQSKLWATLREVIERDPGPFLLALGIELQVPAKPVKNFTQIMTSKGKGGTKEANPIGFTPPGKRQTLCSVGFTPKPAPQPATTTPHPAPAQPPIDHQFDDGDQPLTSTPNADGEIAPPTQTEVHDDRPDVADDTSVVEAVVVPFVELITRHRDCDLDPARFDDSGDYRPARPPAPRRHQQAVDAVLAALELRKPFMHKGMGAAPGRH